MIRWIFQLKESRLSDYVYERLAEKCCTDPQDNFPGMPTCKHISWQSTGNALMLKPQFLDQLAR